MQVYNEVVGLNIRGIHQQDNLTQLKDILRQHDIKLLVLLEPKAKHSELPRFAFSIEFTS